ncbi:MAG: hypothetical protein NZ602_04705 [Thermoguttaceae bacterium]|nr:hypothetical protein [Thermoguttaceae bacterium]MDW8037341.1 hypothetical protein [Thermoguttaceae bacterium]
MKIGTSRRDFLTMAAGVCAGVSGESARLLAAEQPPTTADTSLPQISLGPYKISRLICGSNCFNAGSHLSIFVNYEMRAYYTDEQILKTLRRCEQVGINAWQGSGPRNAQLHRRLREMGSQMLYLAIDAGDAESIRSLKEAGCIAIAHHGERTDQLFKAGRLDQVREYLKKVRDAGLLVGVSTHMPAVVEEIESRGWDLDYYMTCVYERHRSKEELEKLLGQAPIPVGEVYLPMDPPRMYRAIRATGRPCLAFKILAAGRLSERKQWVEEAFQQTFAHIKPTDAVIVGIYDRYSDQPAENAEYVRRFSTLSKTASR